jgi:predicted DNA-binding antitoxin AbrB/MazE fold protein
MELKGKVVDGVIVPDRGVELPDGAEVRIEILKKQQR